MRRQVLLSEAGNFDVHGSSGVDFTDRLCMCMESRLEALVTWRQLLRSLWLCYRRMTTEGHRLRTSGQYGSRDVKVTNQVGMPSCFNMPNACERHCFM